MARWVEKEFFDTDFLSNYVPDELSFREGEYEYEEGKAFNLIDAAVSNFISQIGIDQILLFDDIDGDDSPTPIYGFYLKMAIAAQIEYSKANKKSVEIIRSVTVNSPGVVQIEATGEVLKEDRIGLDAQYFIEQSGIPDILHVRSYSEINHNHLEEEL